MVRQSINSFENAFYHITSRGNRKKPVFSIVDDTIVFIEKLKGLSIASENFIESI